MVLFGESKRAANQNQVVTAYTQVRKKYHHETSGICGLGSNRTLFVIFFYCFTQYSLDFVTDAHKEWKKVMRSYLKENLQSSLKSQTSSYQSLT